MMMESMDKDEGYISPLEVLESRYVFRRGQRTSVGSNSWTRTAEIIEDGGGERGNTSFVTDIVQNSSAIIDSLWLTLPESQAYRMTEGPDDENNVEFEASSIVKVVKTVEKPKYIPLNEFIRDTIDLLCGKQSQTYLLKEDQTFVKHTAVLIHGLTPSTVTSYSAKCLETGDHFVRLSRIDEHFHFHTFVLESASNVCVSFVKFIKDYLKVYQAVVMLKRESIKTLTSLRKFFTPYQQQIQTLMNIMEEQVFATPVLLLKNLNAFMLQTEVPWVSDMLQNLLISCASAYSRYVSDWIFRGKLCSPLEFHITKNRTAVRQNRKFWTHQFSQTDDIPLFLKKFKNYVFDTGRVVNLMQELETKDLPGCFDHDTDLYIKLKLSHQSVVKLLKAHETNLSSFFNEYSYLQSEIEQTVSNTTKMDVQVGQDVIQKSVSEYATMYESNKLKLFLEEKEVKKSRMSSILQEMEEVRNARLKKAIDGLFEEKKLREIGREKGQLNTDQGCELIDKYYDHLLNDFSPAENSHTSLPSSVSLSPTSISHDGHAGPLPQNAEHPHSLSAINTGTPFKNFPQLSTVEKTEKLNKNYPEMGGGDYSRDNREDQKIDYALDISINDFQVKSVNTFQLQLDMFAKTSLPCSATENPSDIAESPTEECDAFLTNRFLSLSVEIPLMTHHKMVNLALLHHIIVTKQLFRHVKIIQDYILLQNGLFGQFLCAKLIDRVKSGLLRKHEDIPGQIFALNHCIDEVLQFSASPEDLIFLDRLKFVKIEEVPSPEKKTVPAKSILVVKKKKQTITSNYDVLNHLSLRYTVDWPLNIFFTDEFFQKYQSLFILQMQLYRSEILLEKTAKILKCKTRSPQLNELLYCRYVMLHFVRSLRSYINVTVIDSSWSELTSSFSKMDSVEKIYELLVQHIKTVISNCLLGSKAKAMMKLITSQLTVIESFCGKIETGASNINWVKGEKIPPKEFKILVQTFKVFREIEKVFVQGGNVLTPGIREFVAELGISVRENELLKIPKAQFVLERLQKYLQPPNSPQTPPSKKKKRHGGSIKTSKKPSAPEDHGLLSFTDVLLLGKRVAESCKIQTIKSVLPRVDDYAIGFYSRGYRAEVSLLLLRLQLLRNLFNYINSPFPRFILLANCASPENRFNDVNAAVNQTDVEMRSVAVSHHASSKEFLDHAIVGASKIGNVFRPREEDEIIGSEEQLEEVQKELMKQIKLLMIDLKQESRIRPRSQDFMVEVIKTGNVPRENINEVDSYILGTFVNEMQLLRLRKTGRGKSRLAMIDFSN